MNMYHKLQSWLAGPFSEKVQKMVQNPYMMALQNCFQTILPMIIVGSLATLINTLKNFVDWMPDLTLINTFTFGLISVFMIFIIPYNIMENKGRNKENRVGIADQKLCILSVHHGKGPQNGLRNFGRKRSNGRGSGRIHIRLFGESQ